MTPKNGKSDKHLVIITPGFPQNESDVNYAPWLTGYVLGLSKEIGPENVSILTIQEPFKEGWYTWNGVKVYSAAGKNKKGLSGFFAKRKLNSAFEKIRKQYPNIVIHSCWLTEASIAGKRFSSRYGYPHIASIFGQDPLPSNEYLAEISASPARIIANSTFTANLYTSSTGKKAEAAITIGINPDMYSPLEGVPIQYELISVGPLHELKQFHLIVRLVEHLKIKFPHLKAAIAGDGPDKDALQLMIDEKGLRSSIHLVGEIPNPDIINFMRQGKIFVHPSRYESSSHAILEANYAGLHVVCGKIGYTSVPGYVHPCEGYAAMHDKIVTLLSSAIPLPPAEVPMIDETIRRYREFYRL